MGVSAPLSAVPPIQTAHAEVSPREFLARIRLRQARPMQ